ncbi:MAG: trigger factor [Planctomycetes bacterium]|nr:trigger factor [Planctomycetota bacterium]
MDFEIKDAGTWKKEVTVKVPKDEIAGKQKEILGELRNTVPVPGFRIGHTPDEILRIRFREDIGNRLKGTIISESAGEAVEKADIKVVSMPEIDHEKIEVSPENDLEYSFTVEIRPEFDLPEYKGLKAEAPSAEVSEEDVDKALDTMRHRVAEYKTVEAPAGPGDVLVGDYTIEADGKTVKEEKETALALPRKEDKDDSLVGLGDLSIPAKPFVKAKAEEEKSVEFTYPEDFKDETLKGKQARFTLKIHEVRRHELPELNEDFAKKVGAENLAALRDALKGRLQMEKKESSERAAREMLIDKLVESVGFELPQELLDSEKQRRETRTILELSRMGVSSETMKDQSEAIKEESAKTAERELRKTFIFSAIAEKEKIEVGDDEVEERIETVARYWRTTPVAARSRLSETGGLSALYQDILEEKVLDLVKENAEISEAAATPETKPEKSPKSSKKKSGKKARKKQDK